MPHFKYLGKGTVTPSRALRGGGGHEGTPVQTSTLLQQAEGRGDTNGTGPGANPPPPRLPGWSLCAAGKSPNSGRLAAESRVPRLSPATDLGPGAALSLFSICKVGITTAPVTGVPGAWGGAPQTDTRDRQGPVCPLRPATRAPHARPRPRSRRLRGQRASAVWAEGAPQPPPPPPGAHSPSDREVAASPPAGRKCSRAPPARPRALPGRSRSPADRCLGDLGGYGRGKRTPRGSGRRETGRWQGRGGGL